MLNEKAKAIYEYIKERTSDGIPPTVREICKELNLKSTSTAHRYINILVEEGLLEKSGKLNRAIKLSGKGATRIPLMGTVTAGQPITAIEDITDYINFQEEKNYQYPLFALKIRGESMINAGIFDGDIVVVEQTPTASNGTIVIALVDDSDATCKTFYKENGHYRLQPENDTMEPIIVNEVKILGRVVALIRYF
ncbi:MAG TPA: transcriptional repressor LexA [Oscillospiraceae bacterium]|nr:transcriptional repressor LexA [Oscillospiraceae bacterium]